jgi:tetratricopeptide (TPR) repeat protein
MDQDKLNSLLNEGIAAARSGQAAQARDLLMQVVEADENNESAWLWLSGVVESLEDRQVCLENVLALNPNSAAAQKGLAWIDQQRACQGLPLEATSPTETLPPSTPEPDAPPAAYQADAPAPPASPPAAAIPPVTAAAPLVRYVRQRKREKRSGPLTVVGIGWLLFGLLTIATGMAFVGFSQWMQTMLQDPQMRAQVMAERQVGPEQLAMVEEVFKTAGPWGIAIAVLGILCVALGVALLQRVEAAFYASFGMGVIVTGLFAYSVIAGDGGGCACCAIAPVVFLVLTFLARDDFAMEEVIVQEKRAEYGTDSPLQHYQRGLEYAKEKKLDMAIQEWEKAVALDPSNLRFRNALALALAGANQHSRAITVLEEALKAFPGDRETKSNLEAIKRAAAKKG